MKTKTIILAALFAALLIGSSARADEVFDAVKLLLEKRAGSQVIVEFDLKRADGTGGTEVKLQGTIIGADGLVLVTGAKQVDPPLGSSEQKPAGFKVRFPGDKKVDATFVGKDDDLNVALVRLDLTGDGEVPEFRPIEFDENASMGPGDQLVVLKRLSRGDEDTLTYSLLRISAVIPRPGLPTEYQVLGNFNGIGGCPAYSLGGKLVGLVTGSARRGGRRFTFVNGRMVAMGGGGAARLLDSKAVTEFLADPSRSARRDCWLGVSGLQALTKPLAEALGIAKKGGLIIGKVSVGSPAERAGLESGDVLKQWDGEALDTEKDRDVVSFQKKIKRAKAGEKHSFSVLRSGEQGMASYEIEVTLEEAPISESEVPEYHDKDFGLKLKPLTRDFLERMRLPVDTRGVRVTSVERASWAQIAGIRSGDVLQKMVLKPCPDLDAYKVIMKDLMTTRDSEVCYNVMRQRKSLFLCVRPDWDVVPQGD